ncbi:MAG: phytanoyl-CoA dioxygenase family protein [Chlamydiae bacterium]|nr:phytanoyl-CoA dioxygenase family protein [Chlamydiota bacterium]MBI3276551.1 phytanoyl-CoA dioxygenase family protein [Chlamydiota bacterium]
MFSHGEISNLVSWTELLENYPEVPGQHMMYFEKSLLNPEKRILNRIENFIPYHTGFREFFIKGKMLQSVSELFGASAVLFKDKINFKLPGGDGFKPHQDQQAGWSIYASLFITVLACIDEATLENGCLELVKGFHKKGLIGKEWQPLLEEEMAAMTFVPYPTQPGDVIFFDSYVPHASGPNLSKKKRRVLYVTYNRLSEGNHRTRYYEDKRKNYPPDCERIQGKEYVFRV